MIVHPTNSNITFLIWVQNSWNSDQKKVMRLEVQDDIFISIYIPKSNYKI